MMVPMLALTLLSATFQANATVPLTMVAKDCGGSNISPELHWSDAPAGTKSFALTVHDPDAPIPGGYYHWALYNLAPSETRLAAGIGRGYYGPCPPPGKVHHYNFTLFALDAANNIIAQTTLTGLYER